MLAQLDCIDDPAMPTLAAVLNPAQLGSYLCQWPGAGSACTGVQVRLLRYHPGKRCVVEITLPTQQGPLGLIGKVYAKDRSDVFRVMGAISAAGFGSSERFSIPQPQVYLQPLQLLLQEKIEGIPSTQAFLSDDESDRETAANRCAGWLAKFHAVAPQLGQRWDCGAYLKSLEQWSHRLMSLGGRLADRAGALSKQLQTAHSLPYHSKMCAIHGDFTHHQLLFLQNRIVTVDWDNYAIADPIRDLARFVVGLKRLALRSLGAIRALDNVADIFLKTYEAHDGCYGTAQLAFHKAAVCMEHAKHDVHIQASGWRERAEITLAEGLRIAEPGA